MIKEAIKYITDLKAEAMEPKVVTIAGKTYCDKDLSRYDDEPMAEPIEASNLSSMIDYILSCTKELRESMIIHVISPTKGKPTLLREYEGILGQIQSIEDALTRVQARRQRAIEALHKFGYDDAHLELETMKFELELLKQDGQNEDNTDDGFLEAMNASAENVWGDEDV